MKPAPVRIVYVSATDEPGGADQSLFELIQGLDRQRFEPHVVLPHRGPFAERYQQVGVPVHVVPLKKLKNTRALRWHLAWLLRAPLRVVRLVRLFAALRPDLIHVNTSVEPLAALAARIHRRRHGTRLFWHVRECELRPRPVERALFGLVGRWADAVVAISQPVAQRFAQRERVYVIPNGVDLERFAAEPRPRNRTPVLGWVGRLWPGKGLENVLELLRLVRVRLPGTRLVVQAAVLREHRDYARALQHDALDLGDAVEWCTEAAHPERVFARMNVFVHLPDVAEGLGRAVLEAQAAGVPVVAWPRGGLQDALVDGVTGHFAADGDIAAAADLVLALLGNRKQRARLGRNGAVFAHSAYSRERCADAMAQAYEEVLS